MVRVVFVGEGGGGKTTLLARFSTGEFYEEVPPVLEEFSIPANRFGLKISTDEIVTFVDTSCKFIIANWRFAIANLEVVVEASEADREKTLDEVARADVVTVVGRSLSGELRDLWLPLVQRGKRKDAPVVFVRAQRDLDVEESGASYDEMQPQVVAAMKLLMEKYPDIQASVNSSAKADYAVAEVFYYSVRVYFLPFHALLNEEEKALTEPCQYALKRIFRLIDKENQGKISDDQLAEFHKHVYGTELDVAELSGVKSMIQSEIQGGLVEGMLTFEGFLFYKTLEIIQSRLESVWMMLYSCGYNRSVKLREDYLFPELPLDGGFMTISGEGEVFLTKLFIAHDINNDGILDRVEFANMFDFGGFSAPFRLQQARASIGPGGISLPDMISLWNMLALEEPKELVKWFRLFGFEDYDRFVNVWRADGKSSSPTLFSQPRNQCRIHVTGGEDGGSENFLDALLGVDVDKEKEKEKEGEEASPIDIAAFSSEVGRRWIYLLLRRIPPETLFDRSCDMILACYVEGKSDSFESAKEIQRRATEKKIPCIFISLSNNLESSSSSEISDLEKRVYDHCTSSGVPIPYHFDMKKSKGKDENSLSGNSSGNRLIAILARIFVDPEKVISSGQQPRESELLKEELRMEEENGNSGNVLKWVAGGIAISAILISVYFSVSYVRKKRSGENESDRIGKK